MLAPHPDPDARCRHRDDEQHRAECDRQPEERDRREEASTRDAVRPDRGQDVLCPVKSAFDEGRLLRRGDDGPIGRSAAIDDPWFG
jgi:hypothetical protein